MWVVSRIPPTLGRLGWTLKDSITNASVVLEEPGEATCESDRPRIGAIGSNATASSAPSPMRSSATYFWEPAIGTPPTPSKLLDGNESAAPYALLGVVLLVAHGLISYLTLPAMASVFTPSLYYCGLSELLFSGPTYSGIRPTHANRVIGGALAQACTVFCRS